MDKISEEIRLLLAFLISILIIFIFNKFQSSKYQKYTTNLPEKQKILPLKPTAEKIIPEGKDIEFENNDYFLKIDKDYGYIKEIGLKKFLRSGEKYFLLNEGAIFFPEARDLKKEVETEIKNNEIYVSGKFNGLDFSKKYKVPENGYIFEYEEMIFNKGERDIEDLNFEIMLIDLEKISRQKSYIPPKIITSINRAPVFIDPFRLKEEKIYKSCRWLGFSSRYSLIFLFFPDRTTLSIKNEGKFIVARIIYNDFILKKGEEKTINFKFYAGPSDYFVARNYINEDIFGKGFFVSIGRFIFVVLNSIHKIIPNWGWSIIVLTIIIKILFFPLTKRTLYSMKQLQRLKPYLQDIQKKYKDNPYQLQKELMNIYKEYNINPFAGCLPMIIQIPIFVGFFLALRNSIFLRGAPFMLWIKDLSMPDTILKIKGFPLNILPFLMTITSYFQQKLTPTTDQSQKTLNIIMPLMFLFILYNFPSGLLLYWVTMNIASLIEQFLISKSFKFQSKK
jgi:YidC/Oxa1 family membrane protein insertase